MSSGVRADRRPRPIPLRTDLPHHRAWPAVVLLLTASAVSVVRAAEPAAEAAGPTDSTPQPVDFLQEVYPIFQLHCLVCHGAEREEGSLRLDRQEYAEKGGHTGRPVLGGDADSNSILQRVSTADVGLRMPRGEPPLTPAEVSVIRRWVEQGTPWVDSPPPRPALLRRTTFALRWPHVDEWNPYHWSGEAFEEIKWWFWRFGLAWIGVLLLIGLCERARLWVRQERPWVQPPRGAIWRRLARVSGAQYIVALLAIGLLAAGVYYQRQARQADAAIGQYQAEIERLQRLLDPPLPALSDLPRPVHPRHPPRLGGEYYRGNDERNPELFNGGFYRTCTMRVWLCSPEGTILRWGDEAPLQGCFFRFEIEQSPSAADQLFAQDIWDNTFVSSVPKQQPLTDPATQVATFREEGPRRWVADYPLDLAAAVAEPAAGIVYIYRGTPQADQPVSGDPHYAAEYRIQIAEGRITRDSELWMGYVFRTGNVTPVQPGRIAEDEWFSFRPIPEIEGAQTTRDEKLLGIEDYRSELRPSAERSGAPPAPSPPVDLERRDP